LSFHRLGVFPGNCREVLIQVWQEPDAVLASILVAFVSRPVILKALFGGEPRLPNVDARQVWIMVWIRGSELWLAENRVVELNDVDNVVKIRYHRASRASWPDYVYIDPYNTPDMALRGGEDNCCERFASGGAPWLRPPLGRGAWRAQTGHPG
jgi:hypothetical protein